MTKQRELGKPGPKLRPLTGKRGGGSEARAAGTEAGEGSVRPGIGRPVEGAGGSQDPVRCNRALGPKEGKGEI